MPSQTRWKEIECTYCQGQGSTLAWVDGYAEPNEHLVVCPRCEGSGHVEITEDAWWDAKLGLTPAVVKSWAALFAEDAPFLEEVTA